MNGERWYRQVDACERWQGTVSECEAWTRPCRPTVASRREWATPWGRVGYHGVSRWPLGRARRRGASSPAHECLHRAVSRERGEAPSQGMRSAQLRSARLRCCHPARPTRRNVATLMRQWTATRIDGNACNACAINRETGELDTHRARRHCRVQSRPHVRPRAGRRLLAGWRPVAGGRSSKRVGKRASSVRETLGSQGALVNHTLIAHPRAGQCLWAAPRQETDSRWRRLCEPLLIVGGAASATGRCK